MAFDENPRIDHSSEVSEESAIATRAYFCQRNGFLAREENPDKGVDLDVELLLDKQVSGFKFAIQIKSGQHLDRVKVSGRWYLRYRFKTSRLGYLCRRKPGLGLIVLYDDQSKRLYYEYVEKVFAQMADKKDDDGWKNKETVIIKIDQRNSLDNVSINHIFETMKRRFLNFSSMYEKNSFDFDLPTFRTDDFEDPIEVLEKYGYVFFNRNEYQIIFNMISTLPPKRIAENHKILLLAAITHYEIGYALEGDFYFHKCRFFLDKYSYEEKQLLSLAQLSSDFFFGRIDGGTYRKSLRELKNSMKKGINSILIRLRLLLLDILDSIGKEEDFFEYFGEETFAIWTELDESDINEDLRQYYLVEIISCVQQMGVLAFVEMVSTLTIRRRILGEPPLDHRVASARALSFLISKPFEFLATIWDSACKSNDDYLKAMVLFKKNYMFFTFSLQYAFLNFYEQKAIDEIRSTFKKDLFPLAYSDLIHAYNLFVQHMNLANAYRTLTLCLEVNFLYSVLFGGDIVGSDFDSVTSALRDLERKLGVNEKYEILTESMLAKYMVRKDADPLLQIPPEKMRKFAREIVKGVGIPEDRIDNVLFDMEFLAEASKRVNSDYFELLQNLEHTKQAETLYKERPKYVIRCKKCGYETCESNDLEALINDLRLHHGYICF